MLGYWQPSVNNIIMHKVTKKYINWIWVLIVIFCVYAGWDTDYEHYYAIFEDLINEPTAAFTTHLEVVYVFIIKYLCFENYSVFRLIIWGIAIILTRSTLKLFNINNSLSICIFILFNLLYFSYARVSLAIALFLYGYALLIRASKFKLYNRIVGILCLLSSIIFHKSCMFLIILLPLSFIPLSSSRIIILLIILPIISNITNISINNFIDYLDQDKDLLKVQSAAQDYSNNPIIATYGLPGIVILILEKCSYLYGLYITWRYLYSRKMITIEKGIRPLFNISFLLFYLSLVFMICNIGYVLERRVLLMSYLPLFYCISYYFYKNFKLKEFIFFSLSSFSFSLLKLCYFYYIYKVR